jgi:hypothetical protein
MVIRVSALALVCALVLGSAPSHAGVIDKAQKAEAAEHQTWSAWGGDIGFRWNRGILGNIGIRIEASPTGQTPNSLRGHEWFDVREAGGLTFTVKNGSMEQFTAGTLQMRGGYVLKLDDGSSIDLRDLSLRVRSDNPKVLDAVSGDGKVWFYSDRVMFELANNKQTLAIRAADLRIAPALANRIGRSDAANIEIADLMLDTAVNIQGTDVVEGSCDPYPWPGAAVAGVSGETYQADLFMQAIQFDPVGCQSCDGPGGANDGTVSWAPSSTLRNNVNDGTAQATISGDPLGTSTALYAGYIAWWTKFTGDPPNYNPPYKNDQHPFLIWDLYRFNADGSFEQIGRSGVKHAFVSVNAGCLDSCDHMGGHALGRGCGDTYGSGNNDSPWDMAPRTEIVPAKAIWGRCGSIFDPNCTGNYDVQEGGNDSWTQRLKTHESQIDPAANVGATYMMDSWYIARQDINIYNSMATVTGTPHYQSSMWSFSGQSNFRLGAAIDRWVDPSNLPPNSMNTELAVNEGHAKLAVKVTDLGDGTWRYNYAVMNLDFARAVTQGQGTGHGPDPRVVSNMGFDSLSIPAGGSIGATTFSNGTVDGANAWTASNGDGAVTWTAPTGGTLDWGTLYSYSIISSSGPVPGNATLHVAEAGTPATYDVATLVPAPSAPDDTVFTDGFDGTP